MKLQVLNGCNCPKDARLIALEGFAERDQTAGTFSLNGEEMAVGDVYVDEAVFWSPSKAALHGDVHLGFFKMKMPRMKLGRISMPKMKFGRIRLPNVGKLAKQALRPLSELTKGTGKFLKSAAKAGGKFLKSAGKAASSAFEAMSQQDAGAPQEEMPEELPPEPEMEPIAQEEDYSTEEAAQQIEDADGNLLGFLPILATAATSLLPALTSGGGIASMIPGLTNMLPQGAQGVVRQGLPIAQRLRAQQQAKARAKKVQQQNLLRQVLRQAAPQPARRQPQQVRPVVQYVQPRPQPVVVREQPQQPQYIPREPTPAPRDNTTLYAIGAASVVLVGGFAYAMASANKGRGRK